MLKLQDFRFKVIYRNGAENADGDTLSGLAWLADPSGAGKNDNLLGVSIEGGRCGDRAPQQ